MMARIGYRRLLPVLFTLAHVALLFYGAAHQEHTLSNVQRESAYHRLRYQEGADIPWENKEPMPLTSEQKIAILLNLPAMFAAIPIAVVFFRGSDTGLLYAPLPFVPLLWYGIGRWLDRLLGHIPVSRRIHKTWRGLFAALSVGLLCLSIASITPLNHHRTGDTYWVGLALILWSALFLAMSMSGFVSKGSPPMLQISSH
jgi:hypothetical protein